MEENVCTVCGRTFIKAPEHLYKIRRGTERRQYQCSYTCWMKARRELQKLEAQEKGLLESVVPKRRGKKK